MMLFPPLFGVSSVVYPCLQVLLLFVYKRQYKKARWCVSRPPLFLCVCAGWSCAFGSFCLHFVCVISHWRRRRRRSDISSIIWYGDLAAKKQCVGIESACGIQLALIYIYPNRYQTRPIANYLQSSARTFFPYECEAGGKETEWIPRREFWRTASCAGRYAGKKLMPAGWYHNFRLFSPGN